MKDRKTEQAEQTVGFDPTQKLIDTGSEELKEAALIIKAAQGMELRENPFCPMAELYNDLTIEILQYFSEGKDEKVEQTLNLVHKIFNNTLRFVR